MMGAYHMMHDHHSILKYIFVLAREDWSKRLYDGCPSHIFVLARENWSKKAI